MATSLETSLTVEQQISQLEVEISERNADIENLTEAIATLQSNQPRPADPSADGAFALLKELVGSVPENLEQQQIYQAKIEVARTSLRLAIEVCDQKKSELKVLRDKVRSRQASQLVQELVEKAQKFNAAIDRAFDLLAEMKSLNGQVSQLRGGSSSLLRTSADLNESPYCRVAGETVLIGRRFDLKNR